MGSMYSICDKCAEVCDCQQWNICKQYCPRFTFFHYWNRPTLNSLSNSSSHTLFDRSYIGLARMQEHLRIPVQENPKASDTLTNRRKKSKSTHKSSFDKALECLGIQPKPVEFTDKGGFRIINITNSSKQRMAIKMKSTNNELFRAKPVHAFLEPESTTYIQIFRAQSYSNKPERIVLFVVKTTKWETEPSNAFNSMLDDAELGIKISVPVVIVDSEDAGGLTLVARQQAGMTS